MMSIFLILMGVFVNAPLEELANPNVTPAVAKAPWYLVGIQELLAYFHPVVAGVLSIAFIIVGAALVPFIDRGPRGDGGSPRPSDRKVGVMLFTIFAGAGLAVTFLGAFFRGPGYAWVIPFVDGLYFAL
jgi:quinol-cytochrome oxidoreductase complex cytochrome b subunit